MVLPLNLAMTPAEFAAATELPEQIAWMSCHFSPFTEGITGLPETLPEGSVLMLDDRISCAGHSANLASQQLKEAVERLRCSSALLDFQRPFDPEASAMVHAIAQALPCPVIVTEIYAIDGDLPVFLAPCPLDMPLAQYLQPWQNREIWLEAALCQKRITVTKEGTLRSPVFPADGFTDGFYCEKLCCRYRTDVSEDAVTFTLFDTAETLQNKMKTALSLGVSRFVGLYQELGGFLTGM